MINNACERERGEDIDTREREETLLTQVRERKHC